MDKLVRLYTIFGAGCGGRCADIMRFARVGTVYLEK